MRHAAKLILPIVFVSLFASCSKTKPALPDTIHNTFAQNISVDAKERASCLQAARKMLGPGGIVLRCGHLTNATNLETVVATRVPCLKDDKDRIPISKLMILRQSKSEWEIMLKIDKGITNSAGYVGINFIYDPDPYPYYRVRFSDQGATWGDRSPSLFTLILHPMTRDGKVDVEDEGLGIGWNPAVGRYQSISPNGEDFEPENPAPKQVRN